jgi:ribosomal protein S27E
MASIKCPVCGNYNAQYDSSIKVLKCGVCKLTKTIEPKKANCCSCGKEYVEFTWFDPSGCRNCHKSFVD